MTFTKMRQKQIFLALIAVVAVVSLFLFMKKTDNTGGSSSPTGFTPVTTPTTSGALTPQPPGKVPEGKVWSPEHGHWHDINTGTNQNINGLQSQPTSGQNTFAQPPGDAPPGAVWSPEHGHWHDAKTGKAVQSPTGGTFPQPPGDVPPGKIWSPEHGHWHDIAIVQPRSQSPK